MFSDIEVGNVRTQGDKIGEVLGVERVLFALVEVQAAAGGEDEFHAVGERDDLKNGAPQVTGVAEGLVRRFGVVHGYWFW